MKILILILLFSTVMFSSSSYAGWTGVSETLDGNRTYYVDFERIRKHDGYVYWWELVTNLKPVDSYLSAKFYKQGDCKLFRFKNLSSFVHKEPMGGGIPSTVSNKPDTEWQYPPPDTVHEIALKRVCNR